MSSNNDEKTITELYESLQEHMVTREEFNESQKQMVTREEFNELQKQMATKEDLGALKIDLKDYIDEKLSDLQGNIVILMRKEDTKVLHLIKILKDKNVLEDKEVKELLRMDPFPKTV